MIPNNAKSFYTRKAAITWALEMRPQDEVLRRGSTCIRITDHGTFVLEYDDDNRKWWWADMTEQSE